MLVVRYAPETELKAGRSFEADIRTARSGRGLTLARITPGATRELLDSLDRLAGRASTVIVTAYVRRVEGAGRASVPPPIATWVENIAKRQRVIVVAFGNPYMIGQFPSVGTYLAAYGVGDDLEKATVKALFGRAPVTGIAPISLPGVFKAGDGLRRP